MADVAQNNAALGPLLIGLAGTEISAEENDWLRHPSVGGVVLFTRNYRDISQLSELTAAIGRISGSLDFGLHRSFGIYRLCRLNSKNILC